MQIKKKRIIRKVEKKTDFQDAVYWERGISKFKKVERS